MRWTLRSKLLAPIITVVAAGLAVVSSVSYWQARSAITANITHEMDQLCYTTLTHLESWMADQRVNLEGWANMKIVQTALQDTFVGQSARGSASGELAAIIGRYDHIEQIYLLNANGQLIASSDPARASQLKFVEEKYFKAALQGRATYSPVGASKISNRPVIMIAVPVKAGDKTAGVLIGAIDIEKYALEFVTPVKVQSTGYLFLFNQDGLVVAHPNQQHVLNLNLSQLEWGRQLLGKSAGQLSYSFQDVEKFASFNFNQALGLSVCATLPQAELLAPVRRSAITNLTLGGVILMATIGVILLLVRGLTRTLDQGISALNATSTAVATTAAHITVSSQSLADGASEQAASIEETSASLEELSSMTKRNAENSQKANDLSKQTRSAADRGAHDMEAMNLAMEAIKISSDDIAKIIKTIDEIAFQTNILALNAAVEAARAGEAGAGFAVVAEEVRNLAQRSATAAKETATKIEGAISKTAQGVELSGKVAVTLNDIVTKARQVDELAAEVAGASQEQMQGITQINQAVGQMDKVTQSNAASAEESAASAQELNAQATQMKQAVAHLLQLVDGVSSADPNAICSSMVDQPSQPATLTPPQRTPANKPIGLRS